MTDNDADPADQAPGDPLFADPVLAAVRPCGLGVGIRARLAALGLVVLALFAIDVGAMMAVARAATDTAATPAGPAASAAGEPEVRVGSKRFTESYLLGEILVASVERGGARATHRQGLGNTAIVLGALEAGSIDVYVEYTGTIAREILRLDTVPALAQLNAGLAARGLQASVPLGFSNGYALAIRGDDARTLGLRRLSDLVAHPSLRPGMTQEFIGRADGWPGLKAAYGLPFATPRGLDHGIAYDALERGQVDLIDVYTTDAKIDRHGLVVLDDDRHYFPAYDAVLLHRSDLPTRAPTAWQALSRLAGTIDEQQMRALNAEAEIDRRPFATVARDWLEPHAGPAPVQSAPATTGAAFLDRLFADDFARLTLEHLLLVVGSVSASVLIGLPLGVIAARHPAWSPVLLTGVGMMQTIPSLALLAFLIPLTGQIGFLPAFLALVIYALLPIVRNTHTGLLEVRPGVREAGHALGLAPRQILRLVELPIAAPTILAGVKTSAVINVGTATIAAFIGAGGYGERIVTGLALNDHATLLAGAVPAAGLALLIEGGFSIIERLQPAPLRATAAQASR